MFLPITMVGTVLNPRPLHSCQMLETKSITVISECGKQIWASQNAGICLHYMLLDVD